LHWRATALAFAVSGHQLVHYRAISLESLALPTAPSLRANPRLDVIQKSAIAFVKLRDLGIITKSVQGLLKD